MAAVWVLCTGITSFCATDASSASPSDLAYGAARQKFDAGHFKEAEADFHQFVTHFASDLRVTEALFLQGLCEMKTSQPKSALRTWNWLLTRYPRASAAADGMEQTALYYSSNGQMDRVDKWLDRMVGDFPRHPATVRLAVTRANDLFAARKFAEAISCYEKVQADLPPDASKNLAVARSMLSASYDPRTLLDQANERLESNEDGVAMALYERYLQNHPKAVGAKEARTRLGWCHYISSATNRYDRAEQQWNEVIQGGPENDPWVGESQWHMVQLLAGPQGKWQEAVKRCDVIVKSFPQGSLRNEQALFSKAWLLWAWKQWARSRAAFDDLLAAYPEKTNHPPILEYIAECDKHLQGTGGAVK